MWCGGGHLHKECPESVKETSVPKCCNCSLREGERPHPSSYRGYSHAKEEALHRRSQRSTPKETLARTFASRRTMPGKSLPAVLRGNPQPQQLLIEPAEMTAPLITPRTQVTGQSVQASSLTTSSLDDMFKVAAIVQQIMTELNGAVSEESKIIKTVLNLMKQNGR
jgi:hypothetical protein